MSYSIHLTSLFESYRLKIRKHRFKLESIFGMPVCIELCGEEEFDLDLKSMMVTSNCSMVNLIKQADNFLGVKYSCCSSLLIPIFSSGNHQREG